MGAEIESLLEFLLKFVLFLFRLPAEDQCVKPDGLLIPDFWGLQRNIKDHFNLNECL